MVSPSLLAADFSDLRKEMDMINSSNADMLHLDIMDGVFVPNISFGFPVLKYVSKLCNKPLDAHFMIVEPWKFIKEAKNTGFEIMNVHYEACLSKLPQVIESIHKAGMKAGITINPETPVSVLKDFICDVELVLVMSVNPGFGGQSFFDNTYSRVRELRSLIDKSGSKALIEVDGGITDKNSAKLYECGADILVSGTFIFKSDNPIETISILKK